MMDCTEQRGRRKEDGAEELGEQQLPRAVPPLREDGAVSGWFVCEWGVGRENAQTSAVKRGVAKITARKENKKKRRKNKKGIDVTYQVDQNRLEVHMILRLRFTLYIRKIIWWGYPPAPTPPPLRSALGKPPGVHSI
jgi:hypothetical protein